MSFAGFFLIHLTLKGPQIPDAEVRFNQGLNVIVGPSNTGKTYIAQCVDFMLGAKRLPKEIPEAGPYDTLSLGLCSRDTGDEFVLERSLHGGDFRLLSRGLVTRILGARHNPDNEENVSFFLLELSGLTDKKVRTNLQGKTRMLSFRDISRLILVDESTIISERSPIFTGQYQLQTAESSVFRFLLTGIDDSSIIAREDPKIAKGRNEGKAEIVRILLDRARLQVADYKADDESDLRKQLARLDVSVEEISQALAAEQRSASALEDIRREAWGSLRKVDSRFAVLAELQKRFDLLQEQYVSDLRRLDAISESGRLLGQMTEERCPVCGALAEHHDIHHQTHHFSLEEVVNSCTAEAKKIRTLLSDLQETLRANEQEVKYLEIEREDKNQALKVASYQLQESLQPRIQDALQRLRNIQSQQEKVRITLEGLDRVRELEELLSGIEGIEYRKRIDGPSINVGTDEAEDFSQEVEAILRSWHFPNLDRVTFSETDQDVVISGQRRASHGKGVRAITHAAFNLALLRFCQDNSKPHPGLVLIDSPLVVYRQPDVGEGSFPRNVKEGFYRALAEGFTTGQVIILENDPPPSDLRGDINLIEFTGTNVGRKGFIPSNG
jgi:hypothetical protein